MTTVGLFDAKHRLSELVERAARGEEITITRRGEVVARLVPPAGRDDATQARAAIAALREARRGVRLHGESLRTLIDEGRR